MPLQRYEGIGPRPLRRELKHAPRAVTPLVERELTGAQTDLPAALTSTKIDVISGLGDGSVSLRNAERGRAAVVRRNEALAEKRAKSSEVLKAQRKERKRETAPLVPVTILVHETLKRKGKKVVAAIEKLRSVMVEVPKKFQPGKGRRPLEVLAGEDGRDDGKEAPDFDVDIDPDTDQRVWGEGVLAEGDLVEGEELDPFAYRDSLRLAGANAVFDSSMTPDEIANMTEDYTNYAGTHEQF